MKPRDRSRLRCDSLRRLFGVNPVFPGSSDRGEATLVLKDAEGRPRVVLGVPAEGDPYLEVRDEEGRTLAELP